MSINRETLPKASPWNNLQRKLFMTGCRKILFPAKSLPLPAFTLIETLLVIGIISILTAIVLPCLKTVRIYALRTKCVHNLKQIDLALQMYLNSNQDTYPCADDPLPSGNWLWMGRGWRSFIQPYLGGKIDANHPRPLLCPQDFTDKKKFESTSYAYSMSFYHSPGQIDDMNSPVNTYQNSKPSMQQKIFSVKNPAGKILIGEWFSNHESIKDEAGWWNWLGARNFLLADSSVFFIKATEIRQANDKLPDSNLTIHGIKGTDWP
jgi:type II secretory pathway pseudopilin PulG